MDYRYRSPLEGSYYDDDQYASNGRRTWPASHFYNREQFHPYTRPSSSSHGQPTYSRRYELSTYPKELYDLFGALECNLCCEEIGSPIAAKMHYNGEEHKKNVKNSLMEWCQRTGNPMPDIEEFLQKSSAIPLLLNQMESEKEENAKKEKDLENAKKENKTCETIEVTSTKSQAGIGLECKPSNILELEYIKPFSFFCELCSVRDFYGPMQKHLNGKKHKERLELLCMPAYLGIIPSNLLELEYVKPLLLICELCNAKADEKIMHEHLKGKKHKNQLELKASVVPSAEEKTSAV